MDEAGGERSERRRGRRAQGDGAGAAIRQMPWKQPRRLFPPVDLLSADEIESIHSHALTVLEDLGMEILHDEARAMLKAAGATVKGDLVRIGREIVEASIGSAPEVFTLHARNPEHNTQIGGDAFTFRPVGGPPNCSDLDRGRRPGSFADSCNFLRLAQHFNCIHSSGYAVDALDIHASIRHLKLGFAKATLTDKAGAASSTGRARLFDGIEMARIARGISHEQLDREPSVTVGINTNSPLKLDEMMTMGIVEAARMNQCLVVTPFTLAGAMAPVTMAGALVEQNAEALCGLTIHQLARRGAPFVYGGFTSNVDMKSGAPAFGTPEYMKACLVGGQLARRYKLPYRTSSTNAANSVDAQAAWESVFSLWGAVMGGGHMIVHAAGWMEGGLVAGYEKYMVDIELLQTIQEFLNPLEMTEDALGIEAMREVGPGGHFFGTRQTLERYSDAFYPPIISDWRNFEQWQAAGSPTAEEKANRLWKQALEEYQEPPMDPAIREELEAFVARRIEEGGQPTDF